MLKENLLSDRMKNDGNPNVSLNDIQKKVLSLVKKEISESNYKFEEYDCECGTHYDELITIAKKDRYGLELNTKICPNCGLLMTNPRMTQETYNKFYDSFYRRLYVGREYAGEEYYTAQLARGKRIYEYITNHLKGGVFILLLRLVVVLVVF